MFVVSLWSVLCFSNELTINNINVYWLLRLKQSHTQNISLSSTNQLCAHCLSVTTDHILSCLPSVPEDYIGRRNLEHVEALQENPVNPNQIVIGYGRGLMVIWDLEKQCALQHIPATQVTFQWQAKYKSVLDKRLITSMPTLDICLVYFACNTV